MSIIAPPKFLITTTLVAVAGLGIPNTPTFAEPAPTPTVMTHTSTSSSVITPDKLVLDSPVIDEAQLLTASEKADIDSKLRQIHKDKLAQMAVVIVPTTGNMDIFEYAYQIAKRWQLGDKTHDDGILMVVAVYDKNMYIVTGYGVEGVLPDVAVKRIIRNDITPHFKHESYAQGINAGIASIETRLRADPETLAKMDAQNNARQDDESEPALPFLIFFGIVFGNILMSMLGRMIGATVATIGIGVLGNMMGLGLWAILIGCAVVWLFVVFGFGKNVRIGTGGGSVYVGGSRINTNTHRGGFGGSNGFGGGGGSFGGGGAGGSW